MSLSGSKVLGLWLALCACLGGLDALGNIDVLQPVIRRSPAMPNNSEDYFGYSVTLHQLEELGDFQNTVENTRIIVGAPQGSFPGGLVGLVDEDNDGVSRTGLVYQCPVIPGSCGGVLGETILRQPQQNMTNVDVNFQPLFDENPNVINEEKEGQFMGATVESSGDLFVACAPLWVSLEGSRALDRRRPQGRCFVAPRNLSRFLILRPCLGGSSLNQADDSYCLTGASATLLQNTNLVSDVSNTISQGDRVVLGAPGFNTSRGQLFYYDPNQLVTFNISFERGEQNAQLTPDGRPVEGPTDLYQGFAVTTGRIFSTDQRDVVTTVPRWNGATYTGRIQVYSLPNLTDIESIFATGSQTGEYFGWAIATADLNGDGLDEVIVGAPMYSTVSQVEKGQVYVFKNTGGNLSNDDVITLSGPEAKGRFGSSVVNIGDVNDDGYEDIAIGAPWVAQGQGPNANGSVYIYYGSSTELITRTPQQVIRATDVLESLEGLTELKTFGYSLASGVDVDANGYYDLLVGAFASQVAVLLRTLSLARVTVDARADRASIDIANTNCSLGGEMFACFTVTVCANYSGRGLDGMPLDATLQITERTNATRLNEQRLFFNNTGRTNTYIDTDFRFPNTVDQVCRTVTVYSRSTTMLIDEITDLVLDISFPPFARNLPQPVTGNDDISDFKDFPLLQILGETSVRVALETRCDAMGDPEVCDSDLRLELVRFQFLMTSTGEPMDAPDFVIVAGQASFVLVTLGYSNLQEDAFGSQLFFTLPSFLRHVRVESVNPPLAIDCATTEEGSNEYVCQLQSPIRMEEMTTEIVLRWQVLDIRGDEDSITVPFGILITANDQNRENDTFLSNNNVSLPLRFEARANLRVTLVDFRPSSIVYSDGNPLDAAGITALQPSDLGPPVEMFVSVENEGPSMVFNARLDIYFPLNGSETGQFYYIYPAEFTSDTVGTVQSVQCGEETFLNPDNLAQGRRKRSTMSPEMQEFVQQSTITRTKRQDNAESAPQTGGGGLNCIADRSSCRLLQCFIRGFDGQITIDIDGFIDQRFYFNQDRTFLFESFAEVTILDDFITEPNPSDNIFTSNTLTVGLQDTADDDDLPIWALVLAGLGALFVASVILALLIVLLCALGFFRRKRPQDAKEEAEEDEGVDQPPPPAGVPPEEEKPPLGEEGSKPEIEPEETSL